MIKLIKYLVIITFVLINCSYALASNNTVDNNRISVNTILTNSYNKLSYIPLISYDLTIVTKEQDHVTSTYKAKVFEKWDDNNHITFYKFSDGKILLNFTNSMGIQRVWLGTINNLPEIKSINIDNRLFNTAISYSALPFDPLWLVIPTKTKKSEGFTVLESTNKNKFSNLSRLEYYFNHQDIPIRVLYYNQISNFPNIEKLVTKYQVIDNGFIFTHIKYKDNMNKRVSLVSVTNIKVKGVTEPTGIIEAEKVITQNIKKYYLSYVSGIRKKAIQNTIYSSSKKVGTAKLPSVHSNTLAPKKTKNDELNSFYKENNNNVLNGDNSKLLNDLDSYHSNKSVKKKKTKKEILHKKNNKAKHKKTVRHYNSKKSIKKSRVKKHNIYNKNKEIHKSVKKRKNESAEKHKKQKKTEHVIKSTDKNKENAFSYPVAPEKTKTIKSKNKAEAKKPKAINKPKVKKQTNNDDNNKSTSPNTTDDVKKKKKVKSSNNEIKKKQTKPVDNSPQSNLDDLF